MFKHGFPPEWSTFKKLIWLVGSGIAGAASGIWKTVTGTLIHLTDALASPMQKCEVTLEPIQDLHGQDAPYPAGGGKNKFDQEYYSDATKYNQNYSGYSYTQPLLLKPNTQYIFKANSTSSVGTAMYFYIRVISGSDPDAMSSSDTGVYPVYNGNLAGSGVGNLFTTDETGAIRFGFPQNTTYLSDLMSVLWQLEEGSTATPYAPYSNVCPITGWTGCEVTRTGKNLIDKSKFEYGTNTKFIWGYKGTGFLLKGGVSYVLTTNTNPDSIRLLSIDESIVYANKSSASTLKYTPTEDTLVVIRLWADSGQDLQTLSVQLEIGNTGSEHEPYSGTTLSVTFPDTVYGGSHEFVSGGLKSKMASVDLGTLTWNHDARYANSQFYYKPSQGQWANPSSMPICTMYKSVEQTWSKNINYTIGFVGPDPYILCVDNRFSTDEDFKAAMSGVQLVYELADPTEIQLTPQEISTLQGINNVWGDGTIELTYKAQSS